MRVAVADGPSTLAPWVRVFTEQSLNKIKHNASIVSHVAFFRASKAQYDGFQVVRITEGAVFSSNAGPSNPDPQR